MNIELQSPEVKDIFAAIVKMQAELENAQKNATNPHFKNDYANLEAVIQASKDVLAKNSLAVIQPMILVNDKPCVVTTLIHSSGQFVRSVTPVMNERNNAQGMGSGISYARRYALLAILGMTQADDDGDEASRPLDKTPEKQIPYTRPAPKQVAPKSNGKDDPWQYRLPRTWKQNGGKSFEEIGADGVLNVIKFLKSLDKLSSQNKEVLEAADLALRVRQDSRSNGHAQDWPYDQEQP